MYMEMGITFATSDKIGLRGAGVLSRSQLCKVNNSDQN